MNDQPPQQPMMYQPPPKKSRWKKFLGIGCGSLVALIVLIVVISMASGKAATTNSTSDTSTTNQTQNQGTSEQPTDAPTQAQKWTTTHTFTGNGTKKTAVFHIGDDWKISWSCDPSSLNGIQFPVQVYVYNSDSTPVDVAVNALCKPGNTSDTTEEHQGGDIYLNINTAGTWKVQVQELK